MPRYDKSKHQKEKWKEAAKRRREQIKQNPELLEEMKAKERQRYHERKKKGEIKTISEMTSKEKTKYRKMTKTSNRKYYVRKKKRDKTVINSCKIAGRKKVKSNRAKVYRDLESVRRDSSSKDRMIWRLRKKLQNKTKKQLPKTTDTPRTKVNKLLGGKKVCPEVRKKLLFGEVITKQLEETTNTSSLKEKHALHKIMTGRIMKKYKLLRYSSSFLSLRLARKYRMSTGKEQKFVKKKNIASNNRLYDCILFFLRDDVTSVCPDKNGYIISYKGMKVKKRKRYLCGTLLDLYQKYSSSVPKPFSYTRFCRSRPFYCVHRCKNELDSCLCKHCENFKLLTASLQKSKIIDFLSEKKVTASICCSPQTEECLRRFCPHCDIKSLKVNPYPETLMVSYQEWKKVLVQKHDKNGNQIKDTTKWDKVEQSELAGIIVEKYKEDLIKYMQHYQRSVHQYKYFTQKKKKTERNTICLLWCIKGRDIPSYRCGLY